MLLDIGPFLGGVAVNLAAALLIVAGIYYPRSRNRDYFLSFLAFNTVIYLVMALLTRGELGIAVGFGRSLSSRCSATARKRRRSGG